MCGSGERCSTEAIADEDVLLRRVVLLDPRHIKPDGTPSSFAYSLRKEEKGLSVDVARLSTYALSVKDTSKYKLFQHTAAAVRTLLLCVCHDPCPKEDPGNVAHTQILGSAHKLPECYDTTCSAKDAPLTITKSVARRLAQNSVPVDQASVVFRAENPPAKTSKE